MVLKIFRLVWFLSVIGLLAGLLYVYAGLPENVLVFQDGARKVLLSRDVLFYSATGCIMLVNLMVYPMRRFFVREEGLRSWFHGLIVTMNFFFFVALLTLSTYNSGEQYDYQNIGIVIYSSLFLMIAWAIGWPVYLLFQKIFPKRVV